MLGRLAMGIRWFLVLCSDRITTDAPVSSWSLMTSALFSLQYRIMLTSGMVPVFGRGNPSASMRWSFIFLAHVFFDGRLSSCCISEKLSHSSALELSCFLLLDAGAIMGTVNMYWSDFTGESDHVKNPPFRCRLQIAILPRFFELCRGWRPLWLFWQDHFFPVPLDPVDFLFPPMLLFHLAFWVVLAAWLLRWFSGWNLLLFCRCFVHIVGSQRRLLCVSGIPLVVHLSWRLQKMPRGSPDLGICPVAVPCSVFLGCLHPAGEDSTF